MRVTINLEPIGWALMFATVVLAVLKWMGLIHLSWFWVMVPVWGGVLLSLFFLGLLCLFMLFVERE